MREGEDEGKNEEVGEEYDKSGSESMLGERLSCCFGPRCIWSSTRWRKDIPHCLRGGLEHAEEEDEVDCLKRASGGRDMLCVLKEQGT